jgi:threonine/homoserine/homoserine lactone efflux protein
MPSLTNLFAFAFIALGMVLTPGPNMIYLISRSIIQGSRRGSHFPRWRGAGIRLLYAVRGVRPDSARFRCTLRV